MEFFSAFREHPFLQMAMAAGVLASIACGISGTFVVVKRIGYISGGIAHSALGGVGIAAYFGFDPMLGALVSSLLAAVILGMVSIHTREHTDTVIGALWAVGMALGIVFLSLTPGYNANIITYLFGNILMVSRGDIIMLLALDVGIGLVVLLLYRQFVLMAFDELYAELRGLRVNLVYIALLCIIALTVVVLIQIVGLILVIALLTLPAAIARMFVRRIGSMILLAIVLGLVFTLAGLVISYTPNLPAGATIIIVAGTGYFSASWLKKR